MLFLSRDAGTIPKIGSQSVLRPFLTEFHSRSKAFPRGNINRLKKAESMDWKCGMNKGECKAAVLPASVTWQTEFRVVYSITMLNKEVSRSKKFFLRN